MFGSPCDRIRHMLPRDPPPGLRGRMACGRKGRQERERRRVDSAKDSKGGDLDCGESLFYSLFRWGMGYVVGGFGVVGGGWVGGGVRNAGFRTLIYRLATVLNAQPPQSAQKSRLRRVRLTRGRGIFSPAAKRYGDVVWLGDINLSIIDFRNTPSLAVKIPGIELWRTAVWPEIGLARMGEIKRLFGPGFPFTSLLVLIGAPRLPRWGRAPIWLSCEAGG